MSELTIETLDALERALADGDADNFEWRTYAPALIATARHLSEVRARYSVLIASVAEQAHNDEVRADAEIAALRATCDALRDAIDAPDRPCSGCSDMVSGDPVCGDCWRRIFPEASALARVEELRAALLEACDLADEYRTTIHIYHKDGEPHPMVWEIGTRRAQQLRAIADKGKP